MKAMWQPSLEQKYAYLIAKNLAHAHNFGVFVGRTLLNV